MGTNISLTRRHFMLGAAAAGATATLPVTKARAAEDTVRVGVIGTGGRGTGHVSWVDGVDGAEVVAVSDCDRKRMASAADKAKRGDVKQYQDYRDLLADDSIDAVAIASPNFWHALHAIEAAQAGKHVYVEKPSCHSIWEGRKMVEAADKYGVVMQVGTQQRSDPALITLRDMIAEKELGEVEWVHSLWYANRHQFDKPNGPINIPEHLDYNLWSGPRPLEPVTDRPKVHYIWHWWWRYGNGDMGNRVIHNIDDIHYVMQMGDDIPTRAFGVGGRFVYDDYATCPDTELIVMDWDVPIVFDSRDLPLVHPKTGEKRDSPSIYRRFGNSFRFTNLIKAEKGFYAVTRGGGSIYDNKGNKVRSVDGDGGGGHMGNFIDAVKARDASMLNAPIHEAQRSMTLMHHGNISYQVGSPASVDEVTSRVSQWEEPQEAWKQTVEHLKRHKVDLSKTKPTLGPWLTFDPESEQFTGDNSQMANWLVRESYRQPFVVPEEV
jgi:predicted dehydrogenase